MNAISGDRWLEGIRSTARLGVKNAFNSAGWEATLTQGSMLGPILWNVMYDCVMRLRLSKGTQIVGFPNGVALVIRVKHLDELVRTSNTAVGRARSWIAGIALKLADNKTEAVGRGWNLLP